MQKAVVVPPIWCVDKVGDVAVGMKLSLRMRQRTEKLPQARLGEKVVHMPGVTQRQISMVRGVESQVWHMTEVVNASAQPVQIQEAVGDQETEEEN